MTDAPAATTSVGTLVRVSVTAGDRRLDLGIPGAVPMAEVVPGLARALGLLDAATAHGGYRLVRADGTPIDSARSLLAEGVEDGAVLTLESGARREAERIYDDVVEAVADAVENQYAPWTPRDSALSAAWAAGALLLAGAALLLGADRASLVPPVVAALAALLALVAGAVVGRVGTEPAAGRVLVLTAPVLAAVAGLSAGSGAPSWGWSRRAAGSGWRGWATSSRSPAWRCCCRSASSRRAWSDRWRPSATSSRRRPTAAGACSRPSPAARPAGGSWSPPSRCAASSRASRCPCCSCWAASGSGC
jgi:hypothetical protein